MFEGFNMGLRVVLALAVIAPPRLAVPAARLVGGTVFVVCVAYLLDQLAGGPLFSGSRAQPSVFNAISALVAFGLPGGAFALWGGRRAAAPAHDSLGPDPTEPP